MFTGLVCECERVCFNLVTVDSQVTPHDIPADGHKKGGKQFFGLAATAEQIFSQTFTDLK